MENNSESRGIQRMEPDIDINHLKQYFGDKLDIYGATPQGADWNSEASQLARFEQLFQLCDPGSTFSINDYGCGYGALVDFLVQKGCRFTYAGFDILDDMILKARENHIDKAYCSFTSRESELSPADYSVESGIFNIRLEYSYDEWTGYVIQTLQKMNNLSRKGFAFNMLTSYSDPPYMKPHLYYADPCYYFDYCKRHFSRNVALLHDYNLYDFTILVKK
jgi:SAM-dependent methyltransferase